jgi:DoxX
VEESNKDKEKEKRYEISPCFSAASDSQSTGGRVVARVLKGLSMKWGKPEWAAIPLRLMLGIILLAAGYIKLTQMPDTVAYFTNHGFPVPVDG